MVNGLGEAAGWLSCWGPFFVTASQTQIFFYNVARLDSMIPSCLGVGEFERRWLGQPFKHFL